MSRQLGDVATATGRTESGVLIPVKTFERAKERLSGALTDLDRERLAKASASRVVAAAKGLDTFVVCDDPEVERWAQRQGAEVISPPQPGLNRAVAFGLHHLRQLKYRMTIIAHADLPMAVDLSWVGDFRGLTIVTDRHGDGTNVMALPTATDFNFSYGPGSGKKHHQEGLRRGLSVRWVRDEKLGHDIDTPADLARLDKDIRSELVGDNTEEQ